MTVPIAEQIKEAERELAMRRSAYPKWIEAGRLKQPDADRQIANQEAIIRTLTWLRTNEADIRAGLKLLADVRAGKVS